MQYLLFRFILSIVRTLSCRIQRWSFLNPCVWIFLLGRIPLIWVFKEMHPTFSLIAPLFDYLAYLQAFIKIGVSKCQDGSSPRSGYPGPVITRFIMGPPPSYWNGQCTRTITKIGDRQGHLTVKSSYREAIVKGHNIIRPIIFRGAFFRIVSLANFSEIKGSYREFNGAGIKSKFLRAFTFPKADLKTGHLIVSWAFPVP